MVRLALAVVTLAAVAPRPCGAEEGRAPAVGDPAPAITAAAWLNVPEGKSPVEGATDKVVMVEFWGTWCGPCVRSMPHVQSLHERYADRGLLLVAITRETAEVAQPFLRENEYTFPVGCDPQQECIGRFHPNGWPSTFLVGKDGKIAYVGAPYDAEDQVRKALGLSESAGALLTGYLDVSAGKDAAATRGALEALLERATPGFDLSGWAAAAIGDVPEAPAPAAPPDGGKLLDACAKAWKAADPAARRDPLGRLAAARLTAFDLRAWAREAYGKAYPVQAAELKAMLEASKMETALDALLDRNPSGAVLAAAGKNTPFADWCRKKAPEARSFARKGLMGLGYMMVEKPPEGIDWDAFSRDLSVSGMAFDADRKHVVGLMIGGDTVMKDAMPSYVERQLARAALMESVASGKPLKPSAAQAEAAKERKKIEDELKKKYG